MAHVVFSLTNPDGELGEFVINDLGPYTVVGIVQDFLSGSVPTDEGTVLHTVTVGAADESAIHTTSE